MPARVQQLTPEAAVRPAPPRRLFQQAAEAAAVAQPARRVAQQAAEAATRSTPGRRALQQAAEAATRSAPSRRLAQQAAEAATRPASDRRTLQQAAETCALASPGRRLYGQLLEVLWREPPAHGLFAFGHDWSVPWRETWRWATDVLESRDGDESRIRLRQRPLRTVRFNALGINAGAVTLDAWLYAHQGRLVWLPLWRAVRWLAAPTPAGAMRLPVIGLDARFVRALQTDSAAGIGPALLLDADGDAQQIMVMGIDAHAGEMLLSEPLVRPVAPDARVAPLVQARLLDEARLERPCGAVAGLEVAFEVAPPVYVHAYSPPEDQLSEGLPVLDPRYWEHDHSIGHAMRADSLDNRIAPVWTRRRNDRPGRVLSWSLLAQEDAEIGRALGLLEYLSGRHTECWIADEMAGLDLVAPAAAGDHWVTVGRGAVPSFLAEPWRALQARVIGQAPRPLRMAAISSVDAATARIHLAAPLAAPLPAGTRLCGLRRARLDQDQVELIWHTTRVLEVNVNFAEIPERARRVHFSQLTGGGV